jgi:hypothetical protein
MFSPSGHAGEIRFGFSRKKNSMKSASQSQPSNLPSNQPSIQPTRTQRWLLAGAILLEAAWIGLLVTLVVMR